MIGLAHGSRHPGVTPAIDRLLGAVAESEGIEARAAYLDLVAPDLATVAGELAGAGHRAAVVVPLLFTSAFHATVDVPRAVAEAASTSGLDLALADVLGTGADVEAVLSRSLVASPAGVSSDPVLLYAVGSSDPAANADIAGLASRLAASGRTVTVGFGTAEPRARQVLVDLESETGSVVILPLFLAPGLLLDPVQAYAGERSWPVIPPLADRAAPILARRYQDRARAAGFLG